MSNIIGVLDSLGGRAGPLTADALAGSVAHLPAAERDALLAGDSRALAALVGSRTPVACVILAPEHDQPLPDEQPGQTEQPVDPPDDDGELQAA